MKAMLNNQWFRTIVSTMIGIIAGLYITNAFENRKLVKAKNIALEQVAIEIANNRDTLQIYHDTLTSLFNASAHVLPQINTDKLIIHKDSLDNFIRQSKRIFTYEEHESHTKDSIRLSGELGIYFTSRLAILDLTQITWEAYKQANLLGITSFECLRSLEDLYSLQEYVSKSNEEWRNIFIKLEFMKDSKSRADFLSLWEVLLRKQSLLLQFYEGFQEEEMMKNCS